MHFRTLPLCQLQLKKARRKTDGMCSRSDRFQGLKKSVALIGMPASGKSTVSKLLSKKLCYPCIDTDQLFERGHGVSVAEFFKRHGEAAFRQEESEVLRQVTSNGPCVLSTGGGVVLAKENRMILAGCATVVYLDVNFQTLLSRIVRSNSRPIFHTPDIPGKLKELYLTRGPIYTELADLVVDASNSKVGDIVRKICDFLEERNL